MDALALAGAVALVVFVSAAVVQMAVLFVARRKGGGE